MKFDIYASFECENQSLREAHTASTDGIHALLTEKKIGREQENELYELIGKVQQIFFYFAWPYLTDLNGLQQDKQLAAAYQQFKATGKPEALTVPLKSMQKLKP